MFWIRRQKVGQWVSTSDWLSLTALWMKPELCSSYRKAASISNFRFAGCNKKECTFLFASFGTVFFEVHLKIRLKAGEL